MPLPLKVQYSIRDAKGITSRTLVHIPSATSIANATAFAQDFGEVIDALILGKLMSVDICIGLDISGWDLKADPDAASDAEEGAAFSYTDALGLLFRQRLPTFSEAFILANTRQVDLANAGVQAYTDMVTAGNGTVSPTAQAGGDLTALVTAKEQFVKNRKGRTL